MILVENLLLPVNVIVKPSPERPLYTAIFLQAFFINDNLPACTAGIGTDICNAGEFFIIIRSCNLHGNPPVFIIGIASIAYAANIMENMITKEKRIAFLMLPATMIEKFVARFLIVTVGMAAAIIVAASLAEITRYLVLPLFNLPEAFHQSVLYHLLSMAAIDGEQVFRGSGSALNMSYQNWLGELCGWAFLVWSHSLYILGGSYWYKKPFFKTLGTLMLISILCSVLSVHIISWVGNDGMRSFAEWLEANFQWVTLNKLLSLGVAFFSAFTMFNWWLSYRLFTRSQVIKPKFRLL